MRVGVGILSVAAVGACVDGVPSRTNNVFLDRTPGIALRDYEAQGYSELGRAYIRNGRLCDGQVRVGDRAGQILLKNTATGEKALCCIRSSRADVNKGSSCKPVAADFALGPDAFSGRIVQ